MLFPLIVLKGLFKVFLSRFEIAPVPSLEKIVAVGEGWLDQFDNRAILKEHGIEQEQRLQHHGQAGRVVLVDGKILAQLGIRGGRESILQLHPLGRKTVQKSLDPRIRQHAIQDGGQAFGVRQAAFLGGLQEFHVRTTAPEGKGQLRG